MRVGVDVGGTFTDLVAIEETGERRVLKLASTPDDQSVAVMEGLEQLLAGVDPAAVRVLGHGTTVGTNAFLTRSGARTALLATEGFEDVLELRRLDRSGVMDPYDLQLDFPQPLVPGRRRIGVRERVVPGGEVEEPLTEDEVARVVEALRATEPEAVAIALLWSFLAPGHERRLKEAVAAALPDAYLSVSHEVDPSIQEYERTSSTVVNAYIGPVIRRYMRRFEERARERGLPSPTIMQSNGGMIAIHGAVERPAALLESGPAAGFSACAHLAGQMGRGDLLAIDMGGTSFETALILDGEPQQVLEHEVEGHAVRMPMLDIRSIGAGGGSIAWIDDGGALRVGPQSAGAVPGPACYGRGGVAATVSDANVVLGYLDRLAGGALGLDRAAAERAVLATVGAPLGLDAVEAAAGVYRIVNAHMADAMRLIAGERGVEAGQLALMAYGGAGPTHAAALARELDIRTTIIPPSPGALSALGVATGDLVHDHVAPVLGTLGDAEAGFAETYRELEARGLAVLEGEGVPPERRDTLRSCVARYIGQLHDLDVSLDGLDLAVATTAEVAQRFHDAHRVAYGFAVETETVFVVSLRVRAVGRIPKPDFRLRHRVGAPEPAAYRPVWFEETGFVETPVYERAPWAAGVVSEGPAIVDEYDSTTVILPGQRWWVDDTGSLVIEEAG
jgi:N-methylhydantoinase A